MGPEEVPLFLGPQRVTRNGGQACSCRQGEVTQGLTARLRLWAFILRIRELMKGLRQRMICKVLVRKCYSGHCIENTLDQSRRERDPDRT